MDPRERAGRQTRSEGTGIPGRRPGAGTAAPGLCVSVRSGARGETQDFDDRVLRALRRADDPSLPIGPPWLRGAALDLTALGSASVLGLVVAAIVGFMLLQGLRRTALLVLVASTGGWLLNSLLKELFQRPRPEIVPHLREVLTLSFPSGHAMTSAAVLPDARRARSCASRTGQSREMYCMGFAMFLAGIIGVSRVLPWRALPDRCPRRPGWSDCPGR